MGRLINSTYISLDGVIENPQNWPSLGSFADDGNQMQTDLLLSCAGVVMGRRTYEGMAPAWTARSGDAQSDRINSMPKYVASSTLQEPEWADTTVLAEDAVARIGALKEGGDLVQYGFGALSYALMNAGLVDELRLWMHPFFVGKAAAEDLLFRPGAPAVLEFADFTPLASGVVVLRYLARH